MGREGQPGNYRLVNFFSVGIDGKHYRVVKNIRSSKEKCCLTNFFEYFDSIIEHVIKCYLADSLTLISQTHLTVFPTEGVKQDVQLCTYLR